MKNVVLLGDVRERLRDIPDASIQTCVTSPPYWGLRDYGTGSWEGGDANCQHSVGSQVQDSKWEGAITTGQRPGVDASQCRLCGATRKDSQIGLEQTPEQYIEQMVLVFREVRRVLRDDGTLWVNIGDSYSRGDRGTVPPQRGAAASKSDLEKYDFASPAAKMGGHKTIKPKDLVGIPWMLAFALRADGWYLRQDIIWNKPNPMPESVLDRCTKAHEYIFLFSKSERYYFDSHAIAEPTTSENPISSSEYREEIGRGSGNNEVKSMREGKWEENTSRSHPIGNRPDGMRNRRSIWTISTKPYKGAHFATFPEELPELCIRAGTSEVGACSACGMAWQRVFERTSETRKDFKGSSFDQGKTGQRDGGDRTQAGDRYKNRQTGWEPACKCGMDVQPCLVLDPFSGSGTTLAVAKLLRRDYLGVELNPEYYRLIQERLRPAEELEADRQLFEAAMALDD